MAVFETIKDFPEEKFRRTVGISLPDFLFIVQLISSFIDQEKEDNPMKKRGIKSKLTIENQVLLFFYYLRDYPTFIKLGQRFEISESYANKIFHRMLDILAQSLKLPNRKVLLEGDFEKILVDVTEQPIERPVKNQKAYYSGKKKDIRLRIK